MFEFQNQFYNINKDGTDEKDDLILLTPEVELFTLYYLNLIRVFNFDY